jgi:hypothetical protein
MDLTQQASRATDFGKLRAILPIPRAGAQNVHPKAFGPRKRVGRLTNPAERGSACRVEHHAEAASSSSSRTWWGLCAAMTFSAISAGTKS